MENISLFMKLINKIGNAVEAGINWIPQKQQAWLQKQVSKVLFTTVKANLLTMQKGEAFKAPSSRAYKALVTTTGAASGAVGSATGIGTAIFATELALSTKFIMRSILDIARSHGEDVYNPETQLACIQVFALGGKSKDDDGLETGYYATRVALDQAVKQATNFISKNGLEGLAKLLIGSANPIVKFIGQVSGRYLVQVSEKFAVQMLPVVGALGGGTINFIFIDHFQSIARAHFTIRALERKYGETAIREAYNHLSPKRK